MQLLPRAARGAADQARRLGERHKPEKLKARAMMEMTRDLNDKYLAALEHRSDPRSGSSASPAIGAEEPRTLQDVMKQAYAQGGSTRRVRATRGCATLLRARRVRLRRRALADVAASLADSGRVKDAWACWRSTSR